MAENIRPTLTPQQESILLVARIVQLLAIFFVGLYLTNIWQLAVFDNNGVVIFDLGPLGWALSVVCGYTCAFLYSWIWRRIYLYQLFGLRYRLIWMIFLVTNFYLGWTLYPYNCSTLKRVDPSDNLYVACKCLGYTFTNTDTSGDPAWEVIYCVGHEQYYLRRIADTDWIPRF